jgi:hypothetical protein
MKWLVAVRPRIVIAILCAVIFGIGAYGIALTADFTKPWGGLSAADWGWMLVSWAGDVAIVYLVVEYVDQRAWKKVQVKVMDLIRRELSGIMSDIANISGVYPIGTILPMDGTEKEEREAYRKAALEKMKKFAGDVSSIKGEVQQRGFLFTGGYGPVLSHRAERLADFQLRYSRFLDVKLALLMMDLEEHLKALDSDVAIVQKRVLFSGLYEEEAYRELQTLLKIIVEAVESKQVELKMG